MNRLEQDTAQAIDRLFLNLSKSIWPPPKERGDKMTIDRAIEILQAELDHSFKATMRDYTIAITLGKQALERVRDERKADLIPLPIPLPGETEGD